MVAVVSVSFTVSIKGAWPLSGQMNEDYTHVGENLIKLALND